MMTKRNGNIKNIFIMLQMGTNSIAANQHPCASCGFYFFKSSRGIKKKRNKPL
jgi:hypothetical protein